jgi:HEAT repeat protein
MKGNDGKLPVAAAQLVAELRDAKMVKAYIEALPSLPASVQVVVISGFATSTNRAAACAVAALAENENAEVSAAALRTLGVIGGAANVPVLVKLALGTDAKATLATASLAQLPGAEVNPSLETLLKSQNPAERAKAIEVFAARVDRGQRQAILEACGDSEKSVRMAAYKALRVLGNESMLPVIADRLVTATSSSERNEIEQTATAVALRCA